MELYWHKKTNDGTVILMSISNQIVGVIKNGQPGSAFPSDLEDYCRGNGLIKDQNVQEVKEGIKEACGGKVIEC